MRIKYGPHKANHLDLYLPKVRKFAKTPVLLYVHSGGWVDGEEDEVEYTPVVSEQLSLGWAVATVDFRLVGEPVVDDQGNVIKPTNPFPAQIRDVKRAIRFVKGYANGCVTAVGWTWTIKLGSQSCDSTHRTNFDRDTVVVSGFSAGGHLAMLAATSCSIVTGEVACPQWMEPRLDPSNPLDVPLIAQNSRPAASMAIAAVMNMRAASKQALLIMPIRWLLKCGAWGTYCDYSGIHRLAPTKYLDATDPPIYFAYGPNDALLPEATHVDPYVPKYEVALGYSRFWVDRMDGPAGRWLDRLPRPCFTCEPGDGVPEYYTVGGHDSFFMNAPAATAFLEKVRSGVINQ